MRRVGQWSVSVGTSQFAAWLLGASAIVAGVGCAPLQFGTDEKEAQPPAETTEQVSGENMSGSNLGGVNLGGSNLGGVNLGGPNLGGSNLGGSNLGGSNLGGTNLGGNNLGGSNLGGSNLGGSNLGGSNLGGSNLGGSNLGGSNLGGSNLGGSNLGGNNLLGTNLGGSNLGGSNTGYNIHGLTGSVTGMLYSGEDQWLPKTGQCIVMGVGSTAFAKLLGQQSANAKISVALGKLPWGFANTSGGAVALDAWEATVWGDKTYCTFVLAAPTGLNWASVAGFMKAVFRWQAPPTQSMDISGIEASAAYDSTMQTSITTYTGMMDTAAKQRAGTITDKDFMAGELAFVTATTNNQSVMVDFSSWIRDKNKNGIVLGNVQANNPPNYAEAMYSVVDNGDGTVGIKISDATAWGTTPASMINSTSDLDTAYRAWQSGGASKPVPRRCAAALYLYKTFGEPVPPGKCDNGTGWVDVSCDTGALAWSNTAGTTAPMNGYMMMTGPNGAWSLSVDGTCNLKPVLSQTYIHMWGPSYNLDPGLAYATGSSCNTSTEDPSKAFDGKYTSSNGTKWCNTSQPSTSSPVAIMLEAATPRAISAYSVTSANDYPTRDPKDWTLQGCNGSCVVFSDTGWTTLDTRTGQTFANRWQTNSYTFSNTTAYSQYRLRITATGGDAHTQLGEIVLGSSTSFSATGLPLAIPDNNTTGVTSNLAVSGASASANVSATVDITHSWSGDLKVTLIGPGGASTVLWNQAGGSAPDVHLSNVSVSSIAGNRNGTWQLKVQDLAAADTGSLTNFKLTFN